MVTNFHDKNKNSKSYVLLFLVWEYGIPVSSWSVPALTTTKKMELFVY